MTTNDVVMATSADDAHAVDGLRVQHAEITGRLAGVADALRGAAGSAGPEFDRAFTGARDHVGGGLRAYLDAADDAIYAAARTVPATRLLAEAHRVSGPGIHEQIRRLVDATERPEAIAAADAVSALVRARLAVEDEVLLPALAGEKDVDLAALAARLPDPFAGSTPPAAGGAGGHVGCACGEHDGPEAPELDVRAIPHAIRHATVFGAFDAVPAGGSMVLVAPHDPIPLLHQLNERAQGRLEVSYEERGPEAWRLRLARI
ncbi:DUF2249 domain-containing protein [Tomitella fengzijianii]|uniref:DUF2249 domain-containing protein n=1 Tax=Tomitella fengzijianii TaxID=2597660 RepID=A0A516X164_9ACTN|nr:DUF2249 domain-containing protein [Tomitella fengzijianii]QDQ96825.1 DUF2249 domain-containing protein [Tomitella fengzijianii]